MEHIVFAVAHIMPCCQGLNHSHPHNPPRDNDSVWHVGDGDTYNLEPERPASSLGDCHLLDVRHYLGQLASHNASFLVCI